MKRVFMQMRPMAAIGTLTRPLTLLASVTMLGLAGCTAPQPGAEFNDPFEAQNRAVHGVNVSLDRAVFGDKNGPRKSLPGPVAAGLGNFVGNLSLPGSVLNSVLQGRPEPAVQNTFRFLVNSTVGIGGLFDPATALGVPADYTDFGETLHVWGAKEGAFLMVPIMGPTTERDLVGKVVDLAINPVNLVHREVGVVSSLANGTVKVNNRLRYSETIESLLYESADSYAQARLLYLQNRHFALGVEEEVFDPYEDSYGE